MKRLYILTLLVFVAAAASAQTKKVSILGDSYSTFQGYNPDNYRPFYPDANNDVKEVEQTWWSLYIDAKGYELDKNNSWGATTICGTGFFGRDVTPSSAIPTSSSCSAARTTPGSVSRSVSTSMKA